MDISYPRSLAVLRSDPKAVKMFSSGRLFDNSGASFMHDPSVHRIGGTRGKPLGVRPASPREASIKANEYTKSSGGRYLGAILRARRSSAEAKDAGKASAGIVARDRHIEAARQHLQAADDIESMGYVPSHLPPALADTPALAETEEAFRLSRRANNQKTKKSHLEAVKAHQTAAIANKRVFDQYGGYLANHPPYAEFEERTPGSGYGAYIDAHKELARLHTDAAKLNGRRHRMAAIAHLIAAQVHHNALEE